MAVSVTIRDVPDETRAELAARAARAGQSLQEYLRGQLIELFAAHELELALGELYEAAVTGVHAFPAASSHASRSSPRSFATWSILSGSCLSRASSSNRWQKA